MKGYYSCWLLLLIVLYGHGEEEDVTVTDETEEENITIFAPTNQWQQILPGQAVPAGLHVRINLQTGEKEAKLIEEENEDNKMGDRRRLHHYGYSDRRGIINKQTKAFKAEELLEESPEDDNSDIKLLTHDITSTDGVGNVHDDTSTPNHDIDNNKKSYKLNLVTDDVKQMVKLVNIIRENSSSSEELIFALTELEYLVHQIDNARDLDIIGGLKLVVFLLEHTNDTVQCNAAHVIGAAAQRYIIAVIVYNYCCYYSNQVVQEACLKYGALGYLTTIIDTSDKLELLYRRTIYAVSALLRLNSEALYNFTFLHNGFDVISKAQFMQRSNRYHLKVVTLIGDLLSEEVRKFVTVNLVYLFYR